MKKTKKYFLKPFSGLKGKSFGGSLDVLRRGPDLVASGIIQTDTGDTLTGDVTWVTGAARVVVNLRSPEAQTDDVLLELPIQLRATEDLLPFVRRDQPWDCWPKNDAFIRAAVQRLNVPNQVAKDIEHDLEVLTALHFSSVKRKPLPRLPRMNSRRRALVSLDADYIERSLASRASFIAAQFTSRQMEARNYMQTSENILDYLELFDEKSRRSGQTVYDRLDDLTDVANKETLLSSSIRRRC